MKKTYKGSIIIDERVEKIEDMPDILVGDFNCCVCEKLTSLKGSPRVVKGYFECNDCEMLETLDGSPEFVQEDYDCSYCKSLTSLQGAPDVVEGEFDCSNCDNLQSVDGAPRKCEMFVCEDCPKLKNLDPLLLCDIDEVVADEHLLEDYYKKKVIIAKYGYEKAMEVFEVLDNLL